MALPKFANLAALSRSLGEKAIEGAGPLDLTQPFMATLQLRALATDQAEARLHRLLYDAARAPYGGGAAQGPARLVGTFKLSVCNDDTCEIETPRIELAVPVS